MGLPKGTGTFLMELEFPAVVSSQIFTEPEVRWWYFWTANKVERMGSTTVRYLIQWMSTRKYTLECTLQALVSDILFVHFCSVQLYCSVTCVAESGRHIAPLCIVNKLDYSVRFVQSVLYAWKRCYNIKPLHMCLSWTRVHSKIGLTIVSATDRGGGRGGGIALSP